MFTGFYEEGLKGLTPQGLRQERRQLQATYQKFGNRATAQKLAVVASLLNQTKEN